MATVIDEDVLAAVKTLWRSDSTLYGLLGDPKTGKLAGSQPDVYGQISVVKGKDAERMTGGIYHDYRDVTITVRGKREDCVRALSAVLDVFNLDTTLTMPSGDRFIRWWPKNDGGTLRQEPTNRKGEEIWAGDVIGEVWTVRTT